MSYVLKIAQSQLNQCLPYKFASAEEAAIHQAELVEEQEALLKKLTKQLAQVHDELQLVKDLEVVSVT